MTHDFISLAIIAAIAAVCPVIAQAIPRRPIPETVFLIVAGAVLGPNLVGVIWLTEPIELLSELGLAFLFLLAGYEIDPKSITGRQGRFGLGTWIVCLALGFLVVRLSPDFSIRNLDGLAVAIALGTTALGTLMPILSERNLMKTPVGTAIISYGTWGELGPVLAMAVLLSSRSGWQTLLILLAFAAVAVACAVIPRKAKTDGSRVWAFLEEKADSTSQTMMRMTVLILVLLVALSSLFDLDIVLGAFAAGFVLRHITPVGSHSLETKLEGAAYGFLIPIFFVVSGAKINLLAVGEQPALLIWFIAMLLAVRAVPVYLALKADRETRSMSAHNRLTVALYCTTALPIIVAVTSVATSAGAMTQDTSSVLVAAGAVTVFLMPLLTSITYRIADVQPVKIVREAAAHEASLPTIVRNHVEVERLVRKAEKHAPFPTAARAQGKSKAEPVSIEDAMRNASHLKGERLNHVLERARAELAHRREDLKAPSNHNHRTGKTDDEERTD